jgi:hypothetical protein
MLIEVDSKALMSQSRYKFLNPNITEHAFGLLASGQMF